MQAWLEIWPEKTKDRGRDKFVIDAYYGSMQEMNDLRELVADRLLQRFGQVRRVQSRQGSATVSLVSWWRPLAARVWTRTHEVRCVLTSRPDVTLLFRCTVLPPC